MVVVVHGLIFSCHGSSQITSSTPAFHPTVSVFVVVYDLGEVGVSEVLVELAAGEEVYFRLVFPPD